MDKEKQNEYANKYYKGSLKFGLVFTILILIFGGIIILVSTILIVNRQTKPIILVSIIMYLASIFDITLAISFHKFNKLRISKISKEEACRRYCKIYGIKK